MAFALVRVNPFAGDGGHPPSHVTSADGPPATRTRSNRRGESLLSDRREIVSTAPPGSSERTVSVKNSFGTELARAAASAAVSASTDTRRFAPHAPSLAATNGNRPGSSAVPAGTIDLAWVDRIADAA